MTDTAIRTISDIARARLRAQSISRTEFTLAEDAARHMLAMQAQDYAGALWSTGLRTRAGTLAEVERAIAERKIVRTWPMRGTLHVLHAEDVHWMVDLLAPRATAAAASRRVKRLGLTDDIIEKAEEAMRSALKGGNPILRSDVVSMLNESVKGFEFSNQHSQHLMRNFGERGIICFGPNEGKQPSFVLLDEWVENPGPKDRGEALAELAERYFISHGPATLQDLARWGMLTMTDAKTALESAEEHLEMSIVEDTAYYHKPGLHPDADPDTFLLPGFDEYILGYKNRDAVLPPRYADQIVPGNNGMFLPTIIVDGQVTGTWKRRINKSGVSFEHLPFDPPIGENGLTDAEARYRQFIGEDSSGIR